MSDDIWRDRRDDDDFSEFGSLFDDAEPTQNMPEVEREQRAADEPDEALSFGEGDTGTLPHWTEPPTGEIPRFDAAAEQPDPDHDELDVWSSFSSEAPVWKDDPTPAPDPEPAALRSGQQRRVTGQQRRVTGEHERVRDVSAETEQVQREPSRITIGTDPSGMPRRPPQSSGRRRSGATAARTPRPGQPPQPSGRDMPAAIAVGLLLAAAFVAALMFRPWAAAAMITLILGLAAVEFYDKVAEKGYRPAVVPGILTCVAAPVAAYWLGIGTLSLVIPFGFMAIAASFIGARSVEAGPMPNVSITTLGIMWIGFLGTFAILILRLSTQVVSEFPSVQGLAEHRGTDTLFLLALGVVANDVGALVFGSAVGRTPLRPWISPNKTVEGFIGGAFATIIALMFVGLSGRSTTWSSNWDLLLLAVVVAVMAPTGDLVESMFKRNLDVKDFGSIVKGHGGVLDRFDGFLFALPAVYYLTLVLEPWTAYTPA
ncbi:MAG: phosphatidate cytidylyltransferase [Acidimicrobiia bacterium]